jgi:hypothetical protein
MARFWSQSAGSEERFVPPVDESAGIAGHAQPSGLHRGLQIFLVLFGSVAILIALMHVALGPAAIPGYLPVNATMDSEDRFYATLFGAFGIALVWCAKDVVRKSSVVYFLMGTFFAGGLARLVSVASAGPPNAFFVAMTGLELLIPPIVVACQRRLSADRRSPT